jgi:hypothetical protein
LVGASYPLNMSPVSHTETKVVTEMLLRLGWPAVGEKEGRGEG